MLTNLLVWLMFGLVVGALARLLVPGDDAYGCLGTALVGIIGSFVGGYLGTVISGEPIAEFQHAGWIGSIIGAVLVLIALRMVSIIEKISSRLRIFFVFGRSFFLIACVALDFSPARRLSRMIAAARNISSRFVYLFNSRMSVPLIKPCPARI